MIKKHNAATATAMIFGNRTRHSNGLCSTMFTTGQVNLALSYTRKVIDGAWILLCALQ